MNEIYFGLYFYCYLSVIKKTTDLKRLFVWTSEMLPSFNHLQERVRMRQKMILKYLNGAKSSQSCIDNRVCKLRSHGI